jgi:hypothetical protein
VRIDDDGQAAVQTELDRAAEFGQAVEPELVTLRVPDGSGLEGEADVREAGPPERGELVGRNEPGSGLGVRRLGEPDPVGEVDAAGKSGEPIGWDSVGPGPREREQGQQK